VFLITEHGAFVNFETVSLTMHDGQEYHLDMDQVGAVLFDNDKSPNQSLLTEDVEEINRMVANAVKIEKVWVNL